MTLELEAVEVRYGDRIAARAPALTLRPRELVALIGPNGAGKTSLLRAVAGLISLEGTISWQGRRLAALGARERARTIAYLPQGATSHWPLPARELVGLGRLPHRRFGETETDVDRVVIAEAMRRADVTTFSARRVDELSGGERARVHLARAFAVAAPLLLVDEPVASLDPYHQLEIMGALGSYAREGALVIAVLHELSLAARFADRIVMLDEAEIVAEGTPAEVLDAATVRRHYRVEPYIADHEGQQVVVPWRPL